ncbi:hypothetical protein ACIQVU_13530 [Lysinibacillus sp. NPDC098008]|uniref:hypothetical protein n=1 Tax=Lysinibacillus sp. NPDC098008 TaxID=3364146 RepID=UPI00381C0B2F
MMAFSRWTNNTEMNFTEIVSNIFNHGEWFEPNIDPYNKESLPYTVKSVFTENQEILLNDSKIYYNSFIFEYSRVRPGEENNPLYASRIQTISSLVIVYSDGKDTQFIINKSGNLARTVLRKLNNHTNNNTVKVSPYNISRDFFDWLIYILLEGDMAVLNEEPTIELKKIVGFKGTTDDEGQKLAEIIGSGDRIMKAISTLAFLLESDEVEYVKPLLAYNNDKTDQDHVVEILLRLNGTIDFNFEKYTGSFLFEEEYRLKTKLILLVSLEIIPMIISKYGESIEEDAWNTEIKISMLDSIGKQILSKVQEKVEVIRKT